MIPVLGRFVPYRLGPIPELVQSPCYWIDPFSHIATTGREKCDGLKPICGTCSLSDRPCTYETQAKKRGIQPGYIRTLELSLAWLFSNFPDGEAKLKRELATENSKVQRVLSSKDTSDSDRLHGRWSKGVVYKQIDQLLSGGEVDSPSRFPIEEGADEAENESPDQTLVRQGTGTANHERTSSHANGQSSNLSNLDFAKQQVVTKPAPSLQLPTGFWRLLDLYYSFTHSWLPISEKHDILKTSYSYPPEGITTSKLSTGSGSHAELWAILALASHQIDPRKPTKEIDSYIENSRSLIPHGTGPFELGHVKAVLLLTLIFIGQGERTRAWMSIGLAIRAAFDLGLHLRTNVHIPRRKHVFLACFVIEALVGILYSLPCHLNQNNYFPERLEEDGLEEWDPWDSGMELTTQQRFGPSRKPSQSLSTFNRLASALRTNNLGATSAWSPESKGSALNPPMSGNGRGTPIPHAHAFVGDFRSQPPHVHQDVGWVPQWSSFGSDPWTPQQLNYETVAMWLSTKSATTSAKESWPAFIGQLKVYIQCFGTSRIPPTAVPLLQATIHTLGLDHNEAELKTMVASLCQIWRPEMTGVPNVPPASLGKQTPSSGMLTEDNSVQPGPNTGNSNPDVRMLDSLSMYSGGLGGNVETPGSFSMDAHPMETTHLTNSASNIPFVAIADFMTPPINQANPPRMGASSNIDPMSNAPGQGTDLESIFEEIARLDETRQANDQPQFMRNLGLGPDQELSAFFGADFLPSDPFFPYMQAHSFGLQEEQPNIFPPR